MSLQSDRRFAACLDAVRTHPVAPLPAGVVEALASQFGCTASTVLRDVARARNATGPTLASLLRVLEWRRAS